MLNDSDQYFVADWSRSIILAVYETGGYLAMVLLALSVATWFPKVEWLQYLPAIAAVVAVVGLGTRAYRTKRIIANLEATQGDGSA